MAKILILDSYSHMFGAEVLEFKYPALRSEILAVLANTEVPRATKPSKEKTRVGELVYSGEDLNEPLARALRQLGWQQRRVYWPDQRRYFIDVDFVKERVGLEVQFGKYSFVLHDFYKFQYLFGLSDERQIDVGVEIVPSSNFQRRMYSGPAGFDSVVTAIRSHARNEPPIPLWIMGIDVADINLP